MAIRGQNKTMMLLLAFVGIFAGYLFYSQTLQDQPLEVAPLPIRTEDDLQKFKDKTLNFSIFDNSVYKQLRTFGEVPVNPGITGKVDIFAPY